MNKITCPECNAIFDPSESIKKDLEEIKKAEKIRVAKETKVDLEKKKNAEIKASKLEMQQDFENQKVKINKENNENKEKIRELLENKKDNDEKIRQAAAAVERARNDKEMKQLKKEYEITRAEDKLKLERTKEDLKKAHERTEQGLTADQGSAQEVILGDYLREVFQDTNDRISPYEKGEPGADWLQEVYEKNTLVGKILFESKKTKSFANKWIDKLQQDMSEVKADVGIIFTTATPKELDEKKGYIQKGNIFICSYSFEALKFLTLTQRHTLKMLNKYNEDNKGDNKMSAFEFLSSAGVQNKMNSLQTRMSDLGDHVDKQKKLTIKLEKTYSEMDTFLEDFLDMATIHGLISKKKKK